MKKATMSVVIAILLFIPIQRAGDASPKGIELGDYHSIPFYLRSQVLVNYELLKTIILLPNSSFNENEALKIIDSIHSIPASILQKLNENHIKIKLFNGLLTDEPTAMHLKGVKPRGYSDNGPTWDDVPGIGGGQVVLVKIGHSEQGKGHDSINLELHELAHSIDKHVFDYIRENKIFLDIWKLEAHTLFPTHSYYLNYPEEYFAESFALYYHSDVTRDRLIVLAPMTASFIASLEH